MRATTSAPSLHLVCRYMDAIGHYKEKYGKLPFDGDEALISALQVVSEVGWRTHTHACVT